jgi:hypothetical protein
MSLIISVPRAMGQPVFEVGTTFEVGSSYIFRVESMTVLPGIRSPLLYCKLLYGQLEANDFDNGLIRLDGDTVEKYATFLSQC